MMCAAERARTEESLQKDAQFQEDMTTPAVRSVVDAVVAEPSMGPYVTVCFHINNPHTQEMFQTHTMHEEAKAITWERQQDCASDISCISERD